MNSFNPIPGGLTVKQVAKMLGVKPSTVRAWISRREIRAYKVDNRRYITTQQINDFYASRGKDGYVDMTYAKGPISNYQVG
jgi:excisionase family DNA binding protein